MNKIMSAKQINVHFFASTSLLSPLLLDPSHPTYSATLPSSHPWPHISECGAMSYGKLYSVQKQLRSWIQRECMQPSVLNVNELAFLQPGAQLS